METKALPVDAGLLEMFLVASAGLFAVGLDHEPETLYHEIWTFQKWYQKLDRALQLDFSSYLTEVRSFLRDGSAYVPETTIIASSYQGHPIAFFGLCAQQGMPITVALRKASPTYVDFLHASGVELVPVADGESPRNLVTTLLSAQRRGRYLVMILDAPAASGRTFDFLGYSVRASRLIETIARRGRCQVVPVFTYLGATTLSCEYLPALSYSDSVTQSLLSSLEQAIMRRPAQYRWRSDPSYSLTSVWR